MANHHHSDEKEPKAMPKKAKRNSDDTKRDRKKARRNKVKRQRAEGAMR